MNSDNQRFLEDNGIDPEKLRRTNGIDCNLYTQEAINRIDALYGFQKEKGITSISIADIIRIY